MKIVLKSCFAHAEIDVSEHGHIVMLKVDLTGVNYLPYFLGRVRGESYSATSQLEQWLSRCF